MQVYTAWLRSYRQDHPEQKIEVSPITMPVSFSSKEETAEGNGSINERTAFPRDSFGYAVTHLAGLGSAFYPLSEAFDPKLATFSSPCFAGPCPEKSTNGEDTEVVSVNFSRVVFSQTGETALFHIGYALRRNKIHYGGRFFCVEATKNGIDWSFRVVGTVGVF